MDNNARDEERKEDSVPAYGGAGAQMVHVPGMPDLEDEAVAEPAVPEQVAVAEETEPAAKESTLAYWWRVLLDGMILLMGMLLITLVVGICSAGALMLLAGGAMEVIKFACVTGGVIGLAVAFVLQVLFMGGMARPVRLCSLLLLLWGLTLAPLCYVAVMGVTDPEFSGELNKFVFTRAETTMYWVVGLMMLELVAWIVLVIHVIKKHTRQH